MKMNIDVKCAEQIMTSARFVFPENCETAELVLREIEWYVLGAANDGKGGCCYPMKHHTFDTIFTVHCWLEENGYGVTYNNDADQLEIVWNHLSVEES